MRRILVPVLAVSALLVASAPANAQAQITRVEISGLAFDSCSNEFVEVTGTFTVLSNSFVDESGRFHFVHRESFHGTAVGLSSGAEYVSNSTSGLMETDSASGNDVSFSVNSTSVFVGKGNAPDRLAHTTNHFTVVDGELKVFISDIRFECRV